MRVGPWWIHPYTLRVTGVSLIAMLWLRWSAARRQQVTATALGWWLLTLAAAALLFGRFGYVATHAPYFRQNPQDVVGLRDAPGINGIGALVGTLLTVAMWAALSHKTLWSRLSLMTPAMLLVAAGGWWACQAAGCAWGAAASAPDGLSWLLVDAPDVYGVIEPRFAVRTLGIVWALFNTALAWSLGEEGAMALPLYLIGGACLTLLRGDAIPMIDDMRADTVAYAGLAVIMIACAAVHLGRSRRARAHIRRFQPNSR